MRKKLLRLVISTLLLLVSTSLVSCISSADRNTDIPTETFVEADAKPSRFSGEAVSISGDWSKHSYSYIITDHQTGKQYLYIHSWSTAGIGDSIVELGSTGETLSNIDE